MPKIKKIKVMTLSGKSYFEIVSFMIGFNPTREGEMIEYSKKEFMEMISHGKSR